MKITGLPQSKELGNIVKHLYNMQLDGNITTKQDAELYLKEKFLPNNK